MRGPVVHPGLLTQVPAVEAVAALLMHVRPALVEAGEEEQRVWAADGAPAVVSAAVQATLA